AITDDQIPVVSLPEDAGQLRVIAGSYQDMTGPAKTFTPMNVWDLRLKKGQGCDLPAAEGWTTALVSLDGRLKVNGQTDVSEAELVLFERTGETIRIDAVEDAVLLYLGGEPIDEPVVGYGPFVMNSRQEIIQAVEDFNSGKFGSMPAA
ncbi:MAG: pirin-like C-terminal cupin domain-containing protein, partial [Rhodospirillales bacterium]